MALPKIFQKLFANDGVGPLLRSDIMPIKTVDGYAPDANGNVDTQRLPLSGGTMVGAIVNTSDSPFIKGDSDARVLRIQAGSTIGVGGRILMCGATSDAPGEVVIQASTSSTDYKNFTLYPDGRLTWGGKEVERVNSSGTNYIRYENGLQICWDTWNNMKSADGGVNTLPAAFVDTSWRLVAFSTGSSSGAHIVKLKSGSKTTSSFALYTFTSGSNTSTSNEVGGDYIAVGKWK